MLMEAGDFLRGTREEQEIKIGRRQHGHRVRRERHSEGLPERRLRDRGVKLHIDGRDPLAAPARLD